ncbi:isochorismatase family protein [Mycolicibacterium sp. HK-90]|uniref:isochorismatase family protein n=1 Tax=Mycolicibacterium sp. HK-90 TaxID=3056937 RepID=UPI002659BEAD|nr:isochorismatase family protein [Mycolicibacterium sp. HK-90]WKG04032.1 isochorismatase family protein [Mycolicibacterium sp. HK-90]
MIPTRWLMRLGCAAALLPTLMPASLSDAYADVMPNPNAVALISIDLQKGMETLPHAPHSVGDVHRNFARIADAVRALGRPVILMQVREMQGKFLDAIKVPGPDGVPVLPSDWTDTSSDIGHQPSDLILVKQHWDAFYGTDLDGVLRKRGVTDIVLTGMSTSFGVESTARSAWERGFNLFLPEDALSDIDAERQDFAVKTIFPVIGHVTDTASVLEALAGSTRQHG